MESVDWRASIGPIGRQKIVNKIIETLMKIKNTSTLGQEKLHDQLKDIATKFEQKIYTHAESQRDYMTKISRKLKEISEQFKAIGNPVNPPDPGVGSQGMQQANNQGQPPHVTGPFNHPEAGKKILPHSSHMNIASSSALQPTLPNIASQNSSVQNIQMISTVPNIVNQTTASPAKYRQPNIQNMSSVPNIASQNANLQNIQNVSGVQQVFVGNSMGQSLRMPSTSNVSQRQIPGSQQQSQNSQHYRHQQQFANQQIQQNNNTTSVQSHIQQQKLMHPTYFQQSNMQPSPVSNAQQNRQPMLLQPSQPVIQHHMQSVIKQERQQPSPVSNAQQNRQPMQPPMLQPSPVFNAQQNQQPISLQRIQPEIPHHQQSVIKQEKQQPPLMAQQQHVGLQSNQKRQLLGTQSGNSVARLSQSTQGQRLQVEFPQQTMPQIPIQLRQSYHQPEANMSQGDMRQRLPTSQVLLNQPTQIFQQQRAMPITSSMTVGPLSPTGDLSSGDWQEEAYQKIKTVKDKYMSCIEETHRKVSGALNTINLLHHDSSDLQQQPKSKTFEDLTKMKQTLETYMRFLQVPKTNILPNYKEVLSRIETKLANWVTSTQTRKAGVSQQQPHVNSSHQSEQTRDHLTHAQPHENHVSSDHTQSVNMSGLWKPTSNMLQTHELKQLQDREMQRQQLLREQMILNQQHQLRPQTNQQHQKQPDRNQINNGKELNVRENTGSKLEPLKQQKLSVYEQQLKSGTPFSSAQTDKRNLLNSASKSSTPSPITVSSPSTSYVSHMPVESEKVNDGILSLSNVGNFGHQPTVETLPSQPLDNAIAASPLSSPIEDRMEHLLRVVKSMSSKSLTSAIKDISSALSTFDSIAQPEPGDGSTVVEVGGAMTKSHLQRPLVSPDEFTDTRKTERLGHTICSDWESIATSTIKRPRIEKTHPLLNEITKINQRLMYTVVDISREGDDPAVAPKVPKVDKGTVVKFSFSPVALDRNLKSQYESESSPIHPLRLLVPDNYPNCSPSVLDEFPDEVSKNCNDLSFKVKRHFSSRVGRFTHPISLSEMARTWDVCARTVILEYAQQSGGGTFTSKYGAWEDCRNTA